MKRTIIHIDEATCTGCGLCVPNCPEGAIQVIDGKARLVSDALCDGLGACIGECPEGAIAVEEREAAAYDEREAIARVAKAGPAVIAAHLAHLRSHGQQQWHDEALTWLAEQGIPVPAAADAPRHAGGCPGMQVIDRTRDTDAMPAAAASDAPSALRQWPVQLKLLNPAAPFFDQAELLVAADCAPFAYANFHSELLRGKVVIMLCPKLDDGQEEYIEKLAAIFTTHSIRSITVAHMEVPCCGGVARLVDAAQQRAGTAIPVQDVTITISGEIDGEL
jgi:NAD-dependent dihydropyrimidine dehydrogenase PreA subunit